MLILVSIIVFQRRNPRPPHACRPPTPALGRHVKNGHVKDATQAVAQDAAQDVAEGVLGAAENGSMKVLIVA